jgi:hypothetical protein
MNDRHISDDRLIEICLTSSTLPLGEPMPSSERAHLVVCQRCEARRAEIVDILAALDAAATEEAATVFPNERLARQQAQILQRVDHHAGPGRVVAFPMQPAATFLMPSRPRMRWAAAVAAAAFVAGVLTGQWTHSFSRSVELTATHVVANETDPLPLRAVPTTFSEEEFLDQVEVAAARNGPVALRPLDAMTPRAWEVR